MKRTYKNIYSFMLATAVLLGLASCGEEFFDQTPSDGVPSGTAIKNSEDLGTARTGMYAALKGTSNFSDYYGQQMFLYGEMHGEDLQYNSKYGSNRASFYYKMEYTSASNFNAYGIWQSPYIVIQTANHIIEAADGGKLTDANDAAAKALIDQYRAEALVLRAMATFDLTRVYGKTYTEDNGASLGVPLVTKTLEATAKPGRSTVAECYTQVIKDLNEAINSGKLATSPEVGYMGLYAAKALLSRVYLTKGDWADALSTAEDVINNSGNTLWAADEYVNAWKKDDKNHSKEMLFELSITNSNDWNDRNGIAYLYAENRPSVPGYGDVCATKKFVELLAEDPQDVRANVFLAPSADKKHVFNGAKVYLNKMPAANGDVRYSNVPILRLSEVYLNAAEAAFKSGNTTKAAQYLNDIIKNRTSDTAQQVTAANITLQRILLERRKELVGEGQRFFDAMRNNETITRYTNDADRGWHDILTTEVRSYNRDFFKSLAAIPSSETDANPNLKKQQNPGYSN